MPRKHRHHWSDGGEFWVCECGERRRRADVARPEKGQPQDRKPPASTPPNPTVDKEKLQEALAKMAQLSAASAADFENLREAMRKTAGLAPDGIVSGSGGGGTPHPPIVMTWPPTTEESGFGNSAPAEPEERAVSPEEAFQIILKYLDWVGQTEGSEMLFEIGGKWLTKITNGITEVIKKHEEEGGGAQW